MNQLAEKPELKDDKDFTFKLYVEIIDISTVKGEFNEVVFIRRLYNADAIVGRELDEKERGEAAKIFKAKHGFKDFEFWKEKGLYKVDIKK